jgi:hypothetical protein
MTLKPDLTKIYIGDVVSNVVRQYSVPSTLPSDLIGWVDDTLGLNIRVMDEDGTTGLAAADSSGTYATVASPITSTTDVSTGPTAFAYINTGARRADWLYARVQLQQSYALTMSTDGAHVQVDLVQLTGTYFNVLPHSSPPTPRNRRPYMRHLITR